MNENKLEQINNVELKNTMVNEKEQKSFLSTTLGKTINAAVDIGIRTILPDLLEEQVINLKDNLINYGLQDGIKKSINEAIDLGKSAIGIVTGNFQNVQQMQSAVQAGGLIDGISEILDFTINKAYKSGILNSTIASTLKNGKNTILNSVENNIEKAFTKQLTSIENIDNHIEKWNKYFNEKNFEQMDKQYKQIEKELKNIVPIENTISKARTIENLHNLVKNNGQNFNLSKDELELAEKLK